MLLSLLNPIIGSLVILLVLSYPLRAEQSSPTADGDVIRSPFHLSWTDKQSSKFDFIFSLETPLKNLNTLKNIPQSSLASCTGFPGCLLQNGTFIQSFFNIETSANQLVYKASNSAPTQTAVPANTSVPARCEKGDITIHHYCSTHWNPPVHLIGNRCAHTIEWHSPYSCHYNTTNYERPCFVYSPEGKLIDLTPWILSNGSSYQVDTGLSKGAVKSFNLNVCNEAHIKCGPNVSACLVNESNHIESGFNNLTSLKYDAKDKSVKLTTLGQYNEQCPDKRVKTVIKFICNSMNLTDAKPKLARWGVCDYLIDWPTIHACPIEDVRAPATDCAIKYEPLGISLDLNKLTKNSTTIQVPGISVNGTEKTMLMGLCRGLSPKKHLCEGKMNSLTSACLFDSKTDPTMLNANNSKVVGTITKSFLRLSDSRLNLESPASNKSCTTPVGPSFNLTSQLGTKIEFFCAKKDEDKPTYLGYDGCTYLFEWGTTMLCFEDEVVRKEAIQKQGSVSASTSTPKPMRLADKDLKIHIDHDDKTAKQLHEETVDDTKQVSDADHSKSSGMLESDKVGNSSPRPASGAKESDVLVEPAGHGSLSVVGAEPKMSKSHKYFMISLISITLAAFVVVILVLDKRTRLGLSLTSIRQQARQALQPQPVPYTRVGQFNDCLDL